MIIYNYKKEFLGIDEKDLLALGFKNLQELQREVVDFADLFVKTPGYIHNFKHVHWIDFITCADSNEESKVIINVNNKNFKATIHISSTYLVDNPTTKGYLVHLANLRELTTKESENISGDIIQREAPAALSEPVTLATIPTTMPSHDAAEEESTPLSLDDYDRQDNTPAITPDPYEAPLDIDFDDEEEVENEPLPIQEESTEEILNDAPLEISMDDDEDFALEDTPSENLSENFESDYVYDPSIASEELGLPLDLIEEFIQDFIEQAKEFKDDLYNALDEGDMDNLKILSHKLKGVAANLRIEDALETITTVNLSNDVNIIRENLDHFYQIIAKLAGEKVAEVSLLDDTPTEEDTDELLQESIEDSSEEIPMEADMLEDIPLSIDMQDDDDLYSDPVDIPELEPEQPTEEFSEEDLKIDLEDFEEEPLETLEIEHPSYNKSEVAAEIGLDVESFEELFEDYINETKTLTDTLQNAIEKEDFTTCKDEALKLKGMSDNMRVTSFSQELQTLLDSSEKQELQNALESIKTALAAL